MIDIAYLIVICKEHDNSILGAAIWSQPEWQASRRVSGVRTYVAFSTNNGEDFQGCVNYITKEINDPESHIGQRYGYLAEHLKK